MGTSYDGYHEWKQRARSFSGMAAVAEAVFVVRGGDIPERVTGGLATAELFPLLGVAPVLGRNFIVEEDRVGGPNVALLSDALWRRRFDGSRDVLGRIVHINGRPYTVVGVMPPEFRYPEIAQLWVPFESHAQREGRSGRDYGVVARLSPGVTMAQADAEMKDIARQIEQQHPEQKDWSAAVTSLRADMSGEELRFVVLLFGAMMFVLLIACTNLAGLLLARGTSRQREMAVRIATGASRRRLVRLLLTESTLVALVGGVLGLVLAAWAIDIVHAATAARVPYWIRFRLDARVLAFSVTITFLTAAVFGLIPALRASRPDLHVTLKASGTGSIGGRDRARLRAALVVTELAVTLVLLAGAGLMAKTFFRMSRSPSGSDGRNLLLSELVLLEERFDDPAVAVSTAHAIIDRLGRVPGTHVAITHTG
ncbi:MAG: ABC transporter permease, partial [Gemmatimonadetes bacterium]|nr:ABC transporter permease [Gemmatimonadota bacterium]